MIASRGVFLNEMHVYHTTKTLSPVDAEEECELGGVGLEDVASSTSQEPSPRLP